MMFETFEQRLTELYQYSIESLKEKKLPNQTLVDFRAFFEGMILFQDPVERPELFEKDKIPVSQSDNRGVEAIVRSQALDKHGGMEPIGSFSGIYNFEELTLYFKSLSEESKHPIVLSLSNNGHTISASYDPRNEKNPWRLVDANQFPIKTYPNEEAISEEILKAFFANKYQTAAFSSTVYATNNHRDEQRQTFDKWKANPSWQKIHKTSNEKANAVDPFKGTWFIVSVRNGQVDSVDKLLKETNIDPNQLDANGRTPLFIAVSRGQLDVVKRLLEDPRINPNTKDFYGENSLLVAGKTNQTEMIKVLLAHKKTDPNMILDVHEGSCALHVAALKGYFDLVKELSKDERTNMKQLNKAGEGVLYYAPGSKNPALFEYLLIDKKLNPNQINNYNESLLRAVLNAEQMDMVKLLLAHKELDLSSDPSVLLAAVSKNATEIVEILHTRQDINPNKLSSKGFTPLTIAVYQSNIDIVKLLLKRPDIDIATGCIPALLKAKELGHIEIEKLIEDAIQMHKNTYLLEPVIDLYQNMIDLLTVKGTQSRLKELFKAELLNLNEKMKSLETLDYLQHLNKLQESIFAVQSSPSTNRFFRGPNADLHEKFEKVEELVFNRFCEINAVIPQRIPEILPTPRV